VEQQKIIALQECFGWQVTQQHLHRHQVDENQPLVAGKPIRAVAEGIRQVLHSCLVIGVEHSPPAHKILVGNLLRQRKGVLKHAIVNSADQGLAQMQLVDAEVDLEQLIDQVHHTQALRILLRGASVGGAHAEAGHHAVGGLLQHMTGCESSTMLLAGLR